MKFLFTICTLWVFTGQSQSNKNFFIPKINSPSQKDSLTLYYNALKVNKYFENNRLYTKTKSRKIINQSDKLNLFESLESAKDIFFIIRKESTSKAIEASELMKLNPGYSDITYDQYYQKIDEHKFYQRELENQIVNPECPMSLYDKRIYPNVINEYKCEDKSSLFYGDIVNIPMYIPVIVKPFAMLTPNEKILREKLLNNELQVDSKNTIFSKSGYVGLPVYMYNNYGSASIIGFINKRVFIKLKPEAYDEYLVQGFARELLNDESGFKKWIKVHYGDYFIAFK